ncbi:beta-ketoacyl-ACP synthase II [Collinsella sp. An2]|uniref:beta-ketoacyl-ACP synthase II n=1 Tax=Collinsella sp. An2 TaxID=1965585 RepID=UPI000B36FCCD|nr:beta-ketoacyl-ACP synthase II [Collinsella sp. An2]OUP08054.1 beta-ketoacyl-[acyl-carrier-protein] synthase II [Collinsella sp. An2]
MEHRVVVTGMGAVTPVGNSAPETWEAFVAGKNGIDTITRFDTSDLKVTVAGEVKDLDCAERLGCNTRHMDLFVQYALVAADEAAAQAGLDVEGAFDRDRVGVYVGSGIGGMRSYTENVDTMRARGARRVSPFMIPMMIANMAAGEIAIRQKLYGPTLPVVTACATSAHTIGEAFRAIKHGYADAILAGGAEGALVPEAVAGFTNAKALTKNPDPQTACRPFDAGRDGFVMGEGAGIVVLEELEHARARGAQILAEVVGYGNTCDGYHITSPDPESRGITRAIAEAIEGTGLDAAEGLYINAHGTSTKLNDASETRGFKLALGEEAARKAHISSTKSMTGHMLGATGAVEAIACIDAIREGAIPPTIHYAEPDPDCDLDYTPNQAVHAQVRWALSTNLGFGGHNAALAFKAYED